MSDLLCEFSEGSRCYVVLSTGCSQLCTSSLYFSPFAALSDKMVQTKKTKKTTDSIGSRLQLVIKSGASCEPPSY